MAVMIKLTMKSILGFIIFALVVVGILIFFSGKEFGRIPQDGLHAGISDAAACMDCHGPGKKNELKKAHPPKFECFKCHKRGDK